MVGLSIILETTKSSSYTGGFVSSKTPQVLNKTAVLIASAAAAGHRSAFRRCQSCLPFTGFLEHCFLCQQRLLPENDIYMYKGDRAFCSVECRSRQMFMDEEESLKKENCSLIANNPTPSACFPSPPLSSAGYSRRRGGGPRNGAGGFAYGRR